MAPQEQIRSTYREAEMSIPSPCINVCRMSADTGLCEGCFRSLDEIARWNRQDDAGKCRILEAVARRREAFGAAPATVAEVRR